MAMQVPNSIRSALRALKYRNYRIFFFGQAVSLSGTWMTRLASSWLVYRLTNDAFLLGAVNFASLIPSFLLAPIAGVFVDRSRDLRRLIVWTQCAGIVQTSALVITVLANVSTTATIAALMVINFLQGVVNAFDMPARQAFLPAMVPDRNDLANGIALNSTLFNGARLVGPAIGGVVISALGEAWCFAIDAVSYVPVIAALVAMRLPPAEARTARPPRVFKSLQEGFRYAYDSEAIRAVLVQVAVLSFMGMPYTVLLPVYAKSILGGGPSTLGLLTGAAGLGAVTAALALAKRETVAGIGGLIVRAGIVFASSVLAFAYSRNLWASCFFLVVAGFGMLMQAASCNTILQTIVSPEKRGRVMSLYSMAFVGVMPFGSLMAGFLAENITAPHTLALCAVLCFLSTALFAVRLKHINAATN